MTIGRHHKKEKKMNKIINVIILTLIGAGSFGSGLYYATKQFDESLDKVMSEYKVISDKVDAFAKVSDPKTIRGYVNDLNKILDDLVGGDLTFDEMVNEIFIRVILEMQIVGNYEVERILNAFKKSLYEAVQREYSMTNDEVVKIINE